MGRRAAAMSAGLVVLVTAGLIAWAAVQPPSRPVAVPGTDVRLLADAEVPDEQLRAVVAGLTAAHALVGPRVSTEVDSGSDADSGADVDASSVQPVRARLSYRTGCEWYPNPRSVATAWVDGLSLCLNAGHPAWRGNAVDPAWPAYVSAHEYVQTAQVRWGARRGPTTTSGSGSSRAWLTTSPTWLSRTQASSRKMLQRNGSGSSASVTRTRCPCRRTSDLARSRRCVPAAASGCRGGDSGHGRRRDGHRTEPVLRRCGQRAALAGGVPPAPGPRRRAGARGRRAAPQERAVSSRAAAHAP